ncbi:sulfur carrier protein ThiS [Fusibacter sp. JL298sf-3]
MMYYRLNGRREALPAGLTIKALIEKLGYIGERIALEINGDVLPYTAAKDRTVNHEDKIEIVCFVGGG